MRRRCTKCLVRPSAEEEERKQKPESHEKQIGQWLARPKIFWRRKKDRANTEGATKGGVIGLGAYILPWE
jgi:hypothetical protein